MQADLRTKLIETTAVAEIATGGITWTRAPQTPAAGSVFAVIRQVGGNVGMNHAGRDHLDTARVQVDCFAPSFVQAAALREAITTALCGFQGTVGATEFTAILPNAPRDFDPVNGFFRCLADLSVTYRAAA